MCAILGITNSNISKDKFKNMLDIMSCRGYDHTGYYFDDDIMLGHKRLAIIDIENGNQPIIDNDYNQRLRSEDIDMYLYVDIVSYYYKNTVEYEKSNGSYYEGSISNGNKKGYLKIENTSDSKLFVQMNYNYAKIETYIDNNDLNQTIMDLSYILSSIKFNDSLLKKMYESGSFSSKDEVYKIFNNKEKEGNFLEYIKEYDKYDNRNDDETLMQEVPITTEKEQTTTKQE